MASTRWFLDWGFIATILICIDIGCWSGPSPSVTEAEGDYRYPPNGPHVSVEGGDVYFLRNGVEQKKYGGQRAKITVYNSQLGREENVGIVDYGPYSGPASIIVGENREGVYLEGEMGISQTHSIWKLNDQGEFEKIVKGFYWPHGERARRVNASGELEIYSCRRFWNWSVTRITESGEIRTQEYQFAKDSVVDSNYGSSCPYDLTVLPGGNWLAVTVHLGPTPAEAMGDGDQSPESDEMLFGSHQILTYWVFDAAKENLLCWGSHDIDSVGFGSVPGAIGNRCQLLTSDSSGSYFLIGPTHVGWWFGSYNLDPNPRLHLLKFATDGHITRPTGDSPRLHEIDTPPHPVLRTILRDNPEWKAGESYYQMIQVDTTFGISTGLYP